MTDRTIILVMSYDSEEQLTTVLSFLAPILVNHREEPAVFWGKKMAYITVQA